MMLGRFERFLKIDSLSITSDIMRARAVYFIAFSFLASQVFNFIMLSYTYGYWTSDHTIGLGVFLCVAASIFALRYTKKFVLFALFYSILLFAGISLSALIDFTGVNSALLPFLLLGSIVNGFISGWRAVLGFGVAAIICVWSLYFVSNAAPMGALFDPALFENRILQRSVQASIALSLSTVIVSIFSYHMHSTFFKLEEKIKQVKETEQKSSVFFTNMSHELRTPLNGILGFCELLKTTSLNPQQVQYASVVSKSADTLNAIVKDALVLSKIDTGSFSLQEKSFNLRVLIQSVTDLYQPIAIRNGVLLGARYQEKFVENFTGDENKIRQILSHLVNNAIKFTPQGSIIIAVEGGTNISTDNNMKTKQTVKISVIDTGVGIAEEHQKSVFDRFSQIDCDLNKQTNGTGLGLALCREIAALMHGGIELKSIVDEGSTFTVSIPLSTKSEDTLLGRDQKKSLRSSIGAAGDAVEDDVLELDTFAVEDVEAA